ncbi:MAG: diaminopimelate epimerase [Blastocatellia bacterium]|jgi:diaminopimelate epimerase|nr:diaminopimelate epimerase [Blastocatellia bacterium]
MAINFTKFQGFGNDYIAFEAAQLSGVSNLNEFARAVCDRHYGAGADGIDVISPSPDPDADFVVRIFNVDGSEANLSGNGTRCAAAYLYYRGLWSQQELRLKTRSGIKLYRLLERLGPGGYLFDSELGQPKFDSASVPMLTGAPLDPIIDFPLEVDGESYPVTALQMGNPNCCVFVEDFAALDWRRIGKAIENHPLFPERTNVIFVRVLDRGNIEERIWERGVGETESSGTCSCAAMVASVINDKTDRRVQVHAPGGIIPIEWRDDGEVLLTGRADVVYTGEWLTSLA